MILTVFIATFLLNRAMINKQNNSIKEAKIQKKHFVLLFIHLIDNFNIIYFYLKQYAKN